MLYIQIPTVVFVGSLAVILSFFWVILRAMAWYYQAKIIKAKLEHAQLLQAQTQESSGAGRALVKRDKKWQWEQAGGEQE